MVRITPSHLQLFGGPGSAPFGELVAEADGVAEPVWQWRSSDPRLLLEARGNRATVGAHEALEAVVTVTAGGASAQATVTVLVLGGGMMP